MELIQNTFFYNNYILLIVLLSISFVIIAYANNKKKLVKVFASTACFMILLTPIQYKIQEQISLNTPELKMEQTTNEVKDKTYNGASTIIGKVISFVFSKAN